jgi:hypothetical protein
VSESVPILFDDHPDIGPGSVIGDDDFEILKSLAQAADEDLLEEIGPFVD